MTADPIRTAVEYIFSLYPFPADPMKVEAYTRDIRRKNISLDWLKEAAKRCSQEFPGQTIPSSGAILALVARLKFAANQPPKAAAVEPDPYVKPDLPDDDPFEKIAQRWDNEIAAGKKPTKLHELEQEKRNTWLK